MRGGAPKSAVVVGGGIVGLSAALALQARGLDVTVLDAPGDTLAASEGNAGHIALEQHDPLASWSTVRSLPGRLSILGGPASFPLGAMDRWLPFGLRLLRSTRPIAFARGKSALRTLIAEALPAWKRLVDDVGAPGLLREGGHVVAWETLAGARRGRSDLACFSSPVARWRDLTADEAKLLAGPLHAPPADAVRFDGTASVADPGEAMRVLRAALVARGGAMRRGTTTLAEARREGADAIVIAAGIGSAALMREIGHRAPLIAERGYHIQSAETRWPRDLPPVVFEERALVATRFLSGLRATSFVEFTRPDAPPDARKWARLEAHAHALGLPFDSPVRTWVGSRPTLPDYLPAIGRSTRDASVLYAFGHNHLGLTLGPVTGEIVAALACGGGVRLDTSPFDVRRFR